MGKRLFFYVFVVVALTDVVSVIINNSQLRYVVKPLILISLLCFYLKSTNKINKQYIVALLLCLAGDVFLLFAGKQNFILGLVSFLLGHVFYIIILTKRIDKIEHHKMLKAVLPFIMVFVVLISILFSSLGVMLLPVIVYGLTICIMGIVAFYNYLVKKNTTNLLFFIGASFFILSDSLLAINKFLQPKHILAILVMVTYITAQYLICKAMLAEK